MLLDAVLEKCVRMQDCPKEEESALRVYWSCQTPGDDCNNNEPKSRANNQKRLAEVVAVVGLKPRGVEL